MKFFSTNRFAAGGAAGALALGTVVTVGAISPAIAGAGTTTYTCTLSTGPAKLPITGSLALPNSVESGDGLAGLGTGSAVTLPSELLQGLQAVIPGIQSIGGTVSPYSLPIKDAAGAAAGAVQAGAVQIPTTSPSGTGDLVLSGAGKTVGGKAPAPGTYEVFMPKQLEFTPVVTSSLLGQVPLGALPCTADSVPASLGTLNVLAAGEEPEPGDGKDDSNIRAWIKNAPVTVGERGRLRVRVTDEDGPAAGKVVVRVDGERVARKALNDRGRTGVRLAKLKRGKHVIAVRYLGNPDTERSRDRVRFRVRRG